jgi:phage shock protein A
MGGFARMEERIAQMETEALVASEMNNAFKHDMSGIGYGGLRTYSGDELSVGNYGGAGSVGKSSFEVEEELAALKAQVQDKQNDANM